MFVAVYSIYTQGICCYAERETKHITNAAQSMTMKQW